MGYIVFAILLIIAYVFGAPAFLLHVWNDILCLKWGNLPLFQYWEMFQLILAMSLAPIISAISKAIND